MEETADLRRAAERYVQQYRLKPDGNLWVAFDSLALDAALAEIPESGRPRVYLARGPDGLETGLKGSINTEIIEVVSGAEALG